MEFRLQLGGVPIRLSFCRQGTRTIFCFLFILSTSMYMLRIYLKLVRDHSLYCLVQAQKTIIRSTPDVGG